MIDYFAANLWQLWALVALLCLITELTNGDLFMICFAMGGVVAAIASALGAGFYAGLMVLAAVSVLCLFTVRPSLKRRLHGRGEQRLSNAQALIGRQGRVSQDIVADGYGRVAIDGDDWKAESADGQAIAAGTKVTVVDMESIIIKVTTSTNP